MKKFYLLAVFALIAIPAAFMSFKKPEPQPKEGDKTHINWLTMDELQMKMKANPKRVYIDFYTDWCGWCKRMDATTFSNPDVVKYMNENFYCVHFDAERKDKFRFMGQEWYYDADKKSNTLAYQLMNGKLAFPTSCFMEPLYQNPQPIPNYFTVEQFECIAKFFATNAYKSTPWAEWQKNFKNEWKGADAGAPPAGH